MLVKKLQLISNFLRKIKNIIVNTYINFKKYLLSNLNLSNLFNKNKKIKIIRK